LNARQHVPIDEYRSNLFAIVAQLRRLYGAALRVIIVTPPPIFDPKYRTFMASKGGDGDAPADRSSDRASAYGAACAAVALATESVLLDAFARFGGHAIDGSLLRDGLHFSESGNALFAKALVETIAGAWPELRLPPPGAAPPTVLPPHLPFNFALRAETDLRGLFKGFGRAARREKLARLACLALGFVATFGAGALFGRINTRK
jgi:hypothetical protein